MILALKKIICVMLAIVVMMCGLLNPSFQVQATELSTTSIYALMQAILLRGGMDISGISLTEAGAKKDLATLFKAATAAITGSSYPLLSKAIDDLADYEENYSSAMSSADVGTTYEYDSFKVTKEDEDKYKLSVGRKLLEEMGNVMTDFADSDDNTFTTSASSSLEDSFSVTYSNYVKTSSDSIDDIADYYSSDVVDAIKALGYDDSNCMVVARNWRFFSSTSSKWDSFNILNGSLPSEDGLYTAFIIIPFGYSYVDVNCSNYYDHSISDTYHNKGGYALSSERFFKLAQYKDNYGASSALSYLTASVSGYDVVYCTSDLSSVSSFYLGFNGQLLYPYWNSSGTVGNQRLFNISNAYENDTFFIYLYYVSDLTMYVESLDITENYVKSSSKAKYDNTSEYVEAEFSSSTSDSLSSYTDLSELLSYTASLSEQLSALKDAIEDNSEETKAQTQVLVDSMNQQTKTLANSIASVTTEVKVQTDAIEGVTEAVKANTEAVEDVIAGVDAATLAITEPLDDILEELRAISVALPDNLTITIPEDKLNLTVEVPDVSTEVINNIEVTQDYDTLQDTISNAMTATLSDVFVPDPDNVELLVGDFNGKFGFVDDLKTNINNVKTTFAGLTPTPYLKIPIADTTSDYDYGFGDYFILDLSWYASYKEYGDTIIAAFLWLFFIWRMFKNLPGIINGAAASTEMMADTFGSVKGDPTGAWSGKKAGEFGAKQWLD